MRILLFLGTNIAIMAVMSIVMKLFGVDRVLMQNGINYQGLLIMAAVIGMTGSFISLATSKWMAKRSVKAEVIENPESATECWLVDTVSRQAQQAGIGMPEVAIFNSPTPNAFATGMNKNNALVAVSTGLMDHMNQDEVEAVLGHEVSHVANGDMVTLALIQGIVNTFVIFLSRVAGYFVDSLLSRGQQRQGVGIGYYISSFIFEMIFGVLASIIVMWFSRRREFRADEGGAALSTNGKMIAALQKLQAMHEPSDLPESISAFGISGKGAMSKLFMTHPPLEERIAALRANG